MKNAFTSVSASSLLGALAQAATLSSTANAFPVPQPPGSQKCFRIAKSGKNACAAGAHSCAGQGTRDADKNSYVYLPVGACARIAGASLSPGK